MAAPLTKVSTHVTISPWINGLNVSPELMIIVSLPAFTIDVKFMRKTKVSPKSVFVPHINPHKGCNTGKLHQHC